MNAQSKSPVSRVITKIVLAAALVAGALVILSGILLNVDRRITVQSKTLGVTAKQSFATLPEYGYIQAHMLKNVLAGRNIPVSGFQAMPDYGYIMAHSLVGTNVQETYLPAGLLQHGGIWLHQCPQPERPFWEHL